MLYQIVAIRVRCCLTYRAVIDDVTGGVRWIGPR